MHGGFPSDNENVNETSMTKTVFNKNQNMLKSIVFTGEQEKESELLNEDNIKDLGN
jgi:hypothetical protein